MPLYEYKCQKCGDVFEVIQKFADEPLTTHAKDACGGVVERLWAAPALVFKGSGWYITDYAKGANSKGPGKNGEAVNAKHESSKDSGSSSKSSDSGSSSKSSDSSSSSSKSDKASSTEKK
jgi:putative FmdB family regulatory protein